VLPIRRSAVSIIIGLTLSDCLGIAIDPLNQIFMYKRQAENK